MRTAAAALRTAAAALTEAALLHAQIQNEGMAAIKNAATHFSTEAYFQNRTDVEDALCAALQARLSQMHVNVPQMFLVRCHLWCVRPASSRCSPRCFQGMDPDHGTRACRAMCPSRTRCPGSSSPLQSSSRQTSSRYGAELAGWHDTLRRYGMHLFVVEMLGTMSLRIACLLRCAGV